MQSVHFWNVLESDGEGNFPARQFGKLPEFCRPRCKDGNPTIFTYIDGWEVVPTDNVFADFETGCRYAEMTVAYARQIGSATFISFVLEAIALKKFCEGVEPSSARNTFLIEAGFFQRIAQITYCGSLD
jgi:hypothetical protein